MQRRFEVPKLSPNTAAAYSKNPKWAVYGVFLGSTPMVVFNAAGAALWLPLYLMKIKDAKNRGGKE
jgi:hypothetical protein